MDVYDAASWMCITALSEESIALGGQPDVYKRQVLGIMSKMEEDKFYLFSYLGILLNVLAIAGVGFILYAGVYGL